MRNNKKIALIGGTGKSGTVVLSELLKRQFCVKTLIRDTDSYQIENPLIELVCGDVRDINAVIKLTEGCQAVVSALGQPFNEPSVFSQATRNVIQAMEQNELNRYILLTGLQVDTPSDKKGEQTQYATDWMKKNYAETTSDKQLEYSILSHSKVNWTLVRLPMIDLTDHQSEILVSLQDCPGSKISAINLAKFLVDQMSDEMYFQKAPFIANK